jgi:hypothetical protein
MTGAFHPHLHTGREGERQAGDAKDRGHKETGTRTSQPGEASRDLGRVHHKHQQPTARHGGSRTHRASAVASGNAWGSRPVWGLAPCGSRGPAWARRHWRHGPHSASWHPGARYRMARGTKCGRRPRPVAGMFEREAGSQHAQVDGIIEQLPKRRIACRPAESATFWRAL